MADVDLFIAEESLAQQLGLDRERLKLWRPKNARKNGGAIEWPQGEAEALAKRLGLSLAQKSAVDPLAPVAEAEEVLTVVSGPGRDGYHFGSHFLIKAKRVNGEVVVVRVMDSRKYVPKMKDGRPMVLTAKKADAGNWWLLVGREPRWKGVW